MDNPNFEYNKMDKPSPSPKTRAQDPNKTSPSKGVTYSTSPSPKKRAGDPSKTSASKAKRNKKTDGIPVNESTIAVAKRTCNVKFDILPFTLKKGALRSKKNLTDSENSLIEHWKSVRDFA